MVESQTSTVFSTLTIYGAIGVVVLLLFERYRHQSVVYFPRCKSLKRVTPPPPPRGFLLWIPFIMYISDDEVLRMVGMDAFIFLRILRLCSHVCFSCGLLGAVFLIPVYAAAPFNHDNPGIRRWAMGNVNEGYNQLWTSWIFVYIFTFIFLTLLHLEYKEFARLRQKYLEGSYGVPSQSAYSVLVEGIPQKYRSHGKLKAFFEKLFPNSVHSAIVSLAVPVLQKKFVERNAVVKSLELAVAKFETTGDTSAKFSKAGKPSMCGGTPGDMRHFLHAELARLDGEIDGMQADVREFERSMERSSEENAARLRSKQVPSSNSSSDTATRGQSLTLVHLDMKEVDGEPSTADGESSRKERDGEGGEEEAKVKKDDPTPRLSSTGFVTFTSQRAQTAAYQLSILDDRYPEFRCFQAPQREDLVWENLFTPLSWTQSAAWVTMVVLDTGIVFWAAIIAFIATISQLAFLAKYLPFVNSLDPVSYSILSGVLPVVILAVFLSLLPVIFAAIASSFEKRKSYSDIQRMVFNWYFAYVLANVYLTLLSGSVASAISKIIGDPTSVVQMLGAALPSVSVFFVNYILAQALMGVPMLLLRIGPLVVWNVLFRGCFDEKKLTRRQLLEGPLAHASFDYGSALPSFMFIVIIFQLYWVISPLITIISFVFFGGMYLAFKYQMLYVFVTKFESGGLMWYPVYYRLNLGLLISSIAMIGYMGIKKGAAQTPLLIPLPFIIILAWRMTEAKFLAVSTNMSFALAADIDSNEQQRAEVQRSFSDSFYRQECVMAGHGTLLRYREGDIPLLNEQGEMNPEYYNDEMESSVVDKQNDIEPV